MIEDVPKGSSDRPLVDVIIADSGEVHISHVLSFHMSNLIHSSLQFPVVHETDTEGNQVPLHAEL